MDGKLVKDPENATHSILRLVNYVSNRRERVVRRSQTHARRVCCGRDRTTDQGRESRGETERRMERSGR